ncbi:unnamed protein product [Spirodela intermedia]|uniref:glycerophosphodiester phosphodiesterase n=1 Tax=Spirodela intermedia TaxID=51605 RepID=A0A7I8IK92_SPIIN|nr:unnamed protein product [Spirodela intermedia]CAA6657783.1 unnamed protein product [Spirodela intermedia]
MAQPLVFFALSLLLGVARARTWPTLSGEAPRVVARGILGDLPGVHRAAFLFANAMSMSDVVLFCDLQLTKDGVGICRTDLRLDNSSNIADVFPDGDQTYKVNGSPVQGCQNIFSRPNVFDGIYPITTLDDVRGMRPAQLWLNVQSNAALHASFFSAAVRHLLHAARPGHRCLRRGRGGAHARGLISSPEIGFLKKMARKGAKGRKMKLIFKFLEEDEVEPTTARPYGAFLQDLRPRAFCSGILPLHLAPGRCSPTPSAMTCGRSSYNVSQTHGLIISNSFPYPLHRFAEEPDENAGKFLTLAEFLTLQANSIKGILVNLENAAYLASKKGLDVVGEVSAVLVNSRFTRQVMIQSDDSSVLARFRDSAPSYRRVLLVKETEITRVAHAVNIPRSSVVSSSGGFLVSSTDVVAEFQAANVSVFVSVLRNEFMNIAFDFLADPIVEIASYLSQFGADGVVTEFPATATAYIRSPCYNYSSVGGYAILPVQPGSLLGMAAPGAAPPTEPPAPALAVSDVVDPPLPPVMDPDETSPGAAPSALPSGQPSDGIPSPWILSAAIAGAVFLRLP